MPATGLTWSCRPQTNSVRCGSVARRGSRLMKVSLPGPPGRHQQWRVGADLGVVAGFEALPHQVGGQQALVMHQVLDEGLELVQAGAVAEVVGQQLLDAIGRSRGTGHDATARAHQHQLADPLGMLHRQAQGGRSTEGVADQVARCSPMASMKASTARAPF